MDDLIRPSDTLERQRDKPLTICAALMHRVEQTPYDRSYMPEDETRAAGLDRGALQQSTDVDDVLGVLDEIGASLDKAKHGVAQYGRISPDTLDALQETRTTLEVLLDTAILDAGDAHEATHCGTAIVGKLILIVEGDDDLATALFLRLEDEGAHVVHVSSAEEAALFLDEIDLVPDAALFGYQMMSDPEGVEVDRFVQSHCQSMPTVILSADRSADLRAFCTLNSISLMHKPLDIEALVHELGTLLAHAE